MEPLEWGVIIAAFTAAGAAFYAGKKAGYSQGYQQGKAVQKARDLSAFTSSNTPCTAKL